MNKLLSIIVTWFFVTSMSYSFAETPKNLDESVKAEAKQFMKDNQIPGLAIELTVHGEPHSYYFGYASRDKKTEIDEKSIFEVGSISKLFIGLILAQKVDYAKLNVNDTAKQYIDELPDSYENITIRQLATQTSGIPYNLTQPIHSYDEMMEYFDKAAFPSAPDEEFIYSNMNVGLLSYVLEKESEKTIYELYRKKIYNIIGMTSVVDNEPNKKQLPHYVQGYAADNKAVSSAKANIFSQDFGLRMSSHDAKIFLNSAIGLPGTPDSIFYPMRLTQATFVKLPHRYQGMGWEIHVLDQETEDDLIKPSKAINDANRVDEVYNIPLFRKNSLVDKTGATNGFRSYIAVLPSQKSGIVVLANKSIKSELVTNLGRRILFKVE